MKKRYIVTEIIIWTILFSLIFTGIVFIYSKIYIEPNIYTIQFRDIDGITKGSPVRFLGINVGYVRHLKTKGKYVDVKILITKKDMKIPNGTIARVEFYGLGGSKSIELMPSGNTKNAGILTGDNIRLNDIILEAIGLVDVVEEIEKFTKEIDGKSIQNALDTISDYKVRRLKEIDNKIDNTQEEIHKKVKKTKEKEKNINKEVNKIMKDVEQFEKAYVKK